MEFTTPTRSPTAPTTAVKRTGAPVRRTRAAGTPVQSCSTPTTAVRRTSSTPTTRPSAPPSPSQIPLPPSNTTPFKKLKPPRLSPTVAEVGGVFLTQNDPLPFTLAENAPLISLTDFEPAYSTRVSHRADLLLETAESAAAAAADSGEKWKLVEYAFLPMAVYRAAKRLHDTPAELLAKYCFASGVSGTGRYFDGLWGEREWYMRRKTELWGLLGLEVELEEEEEGKRARGMEMERGERIERIAFHPALMVLAMSTTWARVHLFDLRRNVFFDYYLVAADDPGSVVITSIAFNAANQLAVGMDSGAVDVWSVNLAVQQPGEHIITATPRKTLKPYFEAAKLAQTWLDREEQVPLPGTAFGFRGSPSTAPRARHPFFEARASPGTRSILALEEAKYPDASGRMADKATLERVNLAIGGVLAQTKLIGAVTAVAFSPSGRHLAVGTAASGVWIYNITTETSYRLYGGSLTAASSRCTCVTWAVPPGVRRLPIKGELGQKRFQYETGVTALVVGMGDGKILYYQILENGPSSTTVKTAPVSFYPSRLAEGVPGGAGISQVLLVPETPEAAAGGGGGGGQYALFPTLLVSIADTPGIHIFRLIPDSVLKASVPRAAPQPSPPDLIGDSLSQLGRLLSEALHIARKLLGDFCGSGLGMSTVHVGTLDTSYVAFHPPKRRGAPETPPAAANKGGYGGIVRSMAIDPTARRLVVSFSPDRGRNPNGSVVWFDASAVTASVSVLGALRVLRPQQVMGGARGVGEVRFAGAFEGGACAGMVTGGGKGVGVFPAWIEAGEGEEGLGVGYEWFEPKVDTVV